MSDKAWSAGFEIEVILGDLDDARFEEDAFDPMDEASPQYCRAVASLLRQHTGYPWTAPRVETKKPGFYVLPEYDLDPLDWPSGRVAGVELLTPPLPLEQAELVRRNIACAIDFMDGPFNRMASNATRGCAWHINIDAGPEFKLSPASFIVGADELSLLRANERYGSSYAAPQRHSWGIALLNHLRRDREGELLARGTIDHLLSLHAGEGKAYACNFEKLLLGYVELRHFSAVSFFDGPPLEELLRPITAAFEMWATEKSRVARSIVPRFQALRNWIEGLDGRFTYTLSPSEFMVGALGELYIDGEPAGHLSWNGGLAITFAGSKVAEAATIRNVAYPDMLSAIAVLAMDLADIRNMGQRPPRLKSKTLQKAINTLASRLLKIEVYKPDPSLRHCAANEVELN
jgi:hypothetical protein